MPGERPLGRAGISMGLAEGRGLGPGDEGAAGLPGGMGDKSGNAVPRLAAQQVEGLEARDLVEVAVPLPPDLLEDLLVPLVDPETVHGDIHGGIIQGPPRLTALPVLPAGPAPRRT